MGGSVAEPPAPAAVLPLRSVRLHLLAAAGQPRGGRVRRSRPVAARERGLRGSRSRAGATPAADASARDGCPGGRDKGKVGEEGGAGTGGEGAREVGLEGVVAGVEQGAVGRVGRVEPAAVAEEPVAGDAANYENQHSIFRVVDYENLLYLETVMYICARIRGRWLMDHCDQQDTYLKHLSSIIPLLSHQFRDRVLVRTCLSLFCVSWRIRIRKKLGESC